jgi:hypothetical protein
MACITPRAGRVSARCWTVDCRICIVRRDAHFWVTRDGGVMTEATDKIPTKYRVIPDTGTFVEHEVLLDKKPLYNELRGLVEPHLGGARLMHVRVLCPLLGEWTDMFADEMGALRRLPRNDAATRIYRNAVLSKRPDDDPEKLPYIAGTAVVFLRPIWGD